MSDDRPTIICTKENPWPRAPVPPGTLILHPDAKAAEQRDGWPSGDLVLMRCPNCGHNWEKELPQ